MTSNEFVKNIESEILNEMFKQYLHNMETVDRNMVTDYYWNKILTLYDALDTEGKENLKPLIRLVMIDLISTIFAKLDGVSSFKNQTEQFELKYGDEIISGDLQEIFLMDIEEEDTKHR